MSRFASDLSLRVAAAAQAYCDARGYAVRVLWDEVAPFQLVSWPVAGCYLTVIYHKFSRKIVWGQVYRQFRPLDIGWPAHVEYAMSFLHRRAFEVGPSAAKAVDQVGVFLVDRPALAEYMTVTLWPGDPPEPRSPCSLLIFAEDGCWKACLSDRDREESLWGTGSTPEQAIDVLEGLLRLPDAPWRKKRGDGRGSRKR